MTKSKAQKILNNLLEANKGNNPEFIISKQISIALGEETYKGHKIIVSDKIGKREAYLLSEDDNLITDKDE